MKRRYKRRYTVIDNKTSHKYSYSLLAWNVAWFLVFISGVITGAVLI